MLVSVSILKRIFIFVWIIYFFSFKLQINTPLILIFIQRTRKVTWPIFQFPEELLNSCNKNCSTPVDYLLWTLHYTRNYQYRGELDSFEHYILVLIKNAQLL